MKKTQLLRVTHLEQDRETIDTAARILRQGGIVAIPTETVYGLAADATNPQAVAEIFAAKGRPADNPLIVHIPYLDQLKDLVTRIPPEVEPLARRFWPGPLTLVLPKSDRVPLITSGGLDTVAVRIPAHPVARAVLDRAGVPLAAPSANRSGSPSPTTATHCQDDLWNRVDAILDGGECQVGVESTVLSLCTPVPTLLRPGAVTLEQLQEVLGEVMVDPGVLQHLGDDAQAHSPGMKYTHYSPRAQVILVRGDAEQYGEYLAREQQDGDYAMCFEEDIPFLDLPLVSYGSRTDHLRQAHELFDVLRMVDKLEAKRVFVHAPDPQGVGLAVYNRLIRAAGFLVVELGTDPPPPGEPQ